MAGLYLLKFDSTIPKSLTESLSLQYFFWPQTINGLYLPEMSSHIPMSSTESLSFSYLF